MHDYGDVNAPQRSNTRNYRVVTMNKMAIDIQREIVTVDFWVALCSSLFYSQYGVSHYSKKDNRELLEDLWIPKDDVSEESAD